MTNAPRQSWELLVTVELQLTPPTPVASVEVRERIGAFDEHVPLTEQHVIDAVKVVSRRLGKRVLEDHQKLLAGEDLDEPGGGW